MAEDEIVRQHHRDCDGEIVLSLEDNGGYEGLMCCNTCGHEDLDTNEQLR